MLRLPLGTVRARSGTRSPESRDMSHRSYRYRKVFTARSSSSELLQVEHGIDDGGCPAVAELLFGSAARDDANGRQSRVVCRFDVPAGIAPSDASEVPAEAAAGGAPSGRVSGMCSRPLTRRQLWVCDTARVAKNRKGTSEHWQEAPEEKDFLAAANYLSLLFADGEVASIVARLRSAPAIRREASDLLRASRLELLPENDPVVKKNLKKVAGGDRLSPVLLARGRAAQPLIVADGYHRICASYYLDENVEISCRLVDSARSVDPSSEARRTEASSRS